MSLNSAHGEVKSIQLYEIKFVSDSRQVDGFFLFPLQINELNVYIHEDIPDVTFVICGVTFCQWCYLM